MTLKIAALFKTLGALLKASSYVIKTKIPTNKELGYQAVRAQAYYVLNMGSISDISGIPLGSLALPEWPTYPQHYKCPCNIASLALALNCGSDWMIMELEAPTKKKKKIKIQQSH